MRIISVIVCYFFTYSECYENNVCPTLEDYYTIKDNPRCEYDIAAESTDVMEIALHYGYSAEPHKVVSVDKYILTMFRIYVDDTRKRHPVFLQHGLISSALIFFGRRKESLPFVLVDAGYDVWVGNIRGNEYSQEHVNLTVYDAQYWDYRVDNIGMIDIPTQLEYIAEVTNQKGNIIFIGHSLGTSLGLIYASAFPEKARKTLKLIILLAPAYKLTNTKAPMFMLLRAIFGTGTTVVRFVEQNHLMRLASQIEVFRPLTQTLCFKSPHTMHFGLGTLQPNELGKYRFFLPMLNKLLFDPQKTLPVVGTQAPSGVSLRVTEFVGEMFNGNFRMHDYGKKNIEKYGSRIPPDYDISKIEVPVVVFSAVNDYLCTVQDTRILYQSLSPRARHGLYIITDPNFNHGDFLYGDNVKTLLYDRIVDILRRFKR